ncbi:MAG: glycosyltransferase [Candidatus Didemnitutus sp.]|nr:glycosyltransferase [Candidatus Didemnitutus sp.]
MQLSVILSTHNPHPERLRRTLAGLRAQTLPLTAWELLLVDNASTTPLATAQFADVAPANLRLVREATLGLTAARRCGVRATAGALVVLVDDDNVLAPDYLARVLQHFADHPRLGALGGRSVPEFESPPPSWLREFDSLLACRDLGDAVIVAEQFHNPATDANEYPLCAPIGAGMALRRAALANWLAHDDAGLLSDRRGNELTSGGDNELVLSVFESGWSVAYFPDLALLHLIPTTRMQPAYLARLNRAIARSWLQVLARHNACPWTRIPRWTLPLRFAKAWFAHRPGRSAAAHIRWQGACGHYEGQSLLSS